MGQLVFWFYNVIPTRTNGQLLFFYLKQITGLNYHTERQRRLVFPLSKKVMLNNCSVHHLLNFVLICKGQARVLIKFPGIT